MTETLQAAIQAVEECQRLANELDGVPPPQERAAELEVPEEPEFPTALQSAKQAVQAAMDLVDGPALAELDFTEAALDSAQTAWSDGTASDRSLAIEHVAEAHRRAQDARRCIRQDL